MIQSVHGPPSHLNEAGDYAEQFPYQDDPDSPRRIINENSDILAADLAAIMKYIPTCIDEPAVSLLPPNYPRSEDTLILCHLKWDNI
jgi:hypothetical protein